MLSQNWRRRLKIALISLITLELLLWAIPPLLRSTAETQLSQLLHRKVHIGQLGLNPLSLTLRIGDLNIQSPQGQPLLAFDELQVNASLWGSLRHRGAVIDAITLEHPKLYLARTGDNHYNISDLIEEFLDKPDDDEPTRFSLNNLQLRHGEITFDDVPLQARQQISQLQLALPFVSNLPYQLENPVQPGLSGLLNGARFSSHAKTKPFSPTHESQLDIALDDVDLTHYLSYAPLPLQFKLDSARLDSKLRLSFAQPKDQPPSIALSGQLALRQLKLLQLDGAPLLAWDKAALDIAQLQPLQQRYQIKQLLLQQPSLQLRRDKNGQLNLLQAFASPAAKPATVNEKAGNKPTAAKPLQFGLQHLALQQGQLSWRDDTNGFSTQLAPINAHIEHFELKPGHAATFNLQLQSAQQEGLSGKGQFKLQPFALQGELQLTQLALPYYAPLLRQQTPIRISDGKLDLSTHIDFGDSGLKLQQLTLALQSLALLPPQQKQPALSLQTLQLADGQLDLTQRQLSLGSVQSSGLQFNVKRDSAGQIDWQQWLQGKVAPAKPGAAAPAWGWKIGQLTLDNYAVNFDDDQATQPAHIKLSQLQLKAQNLGPKQAIPLDLATRINRSGTLAANGTLQLQPLSGDMRLKLNQVDIVQLQPYFSDKLNISLSSGQLNAAGQLRFIQGEKVTGSFNGGVSINKLASVDKKYGQDFLNWKSLQINGIKANERQVSIDQINLNDFYSRLLVNADGRLNLLDIATKPDEANSAVGTSPATTTQPTEKPEPFPLHINKVKLTGGNIQFSDYFIRPNYSANMTQIGGTISGLSTQADSRAGMELLGSVNNNAQFSLAGTLNPLSKQLYLDIKAGIKGFEMIPASPYSGKYAGYGIQKGKLSMEISYFVDQNKLKAQNHLFIDQFTFGDKTDSPDATSLPVQLAVSLLQNRRGEIDINLPIEGSLDDPELKVGRIVVQMLKNLLEKAVTAPFALLTSGSGGEELSYIDFEPGSSKLNAAAETKLATLAAALGDRPALKLEIAGQADLVADSAGLKKLALEQKVRAQKLKNMAQLGQTADDTLKINAEEYPLLLKAAYKAEDFKKPRNMVGLVKDLPVAEMEALMLANIEIQPDDLRQLANRRAFAAKNALLKGNKVEDARLFIVAGNNNKAATDKATPSRVDFNLSGT